MHLYYYPPEETFIGPDTFDEFKTGLEWRWYEALPQSYVEPRNKPAGGNGERPEWSKELFRSLTPIRLFKVSNVYFFPWSGVIISSDGGVLRIPAGETGSMGRNLNFLPFCDSDGLRTSFLPPQDLPSIENIAVTVPFGGGSGGNYGHFLLDALPAACLFDELGLLKNWLLVAPELRQWQSRHFDILGLQPTVLKDYVYKIKTAIYSNAMDHNLLRPNINYREVRRRGLAARRINNDSLPKRIYLSRGSISSRINHTEAYLQDALKGVGFSIIDPALFTVDDQIEICSNAEVITGCTGAAFANALYANSESLVVEIQPTGMHYGWVQDLCAIVGCKYAPYFVKGDVTNLEVPNAGLDFTVDVNDFLKYLNECGI